MKKLIHEVKEKSGETYQLYGELEKCYHPEGYHTLVFTTAWSGSKNPKLERTTSKIMLSPESLDNLKALLEGKE
jgi:hypothetical protein